MEKTSPTKGKINSIRRKNKLLLCNRKQMKKDIREGLSKNRRTSKRISKMEDRVFGYREKREKKEKRKNNYCQVTV